MEIQYAIQETMFDNNESIKCFQVLIKDSVKILTMVT